MATFTVRMVLHKAAWDDYVQLAAEMAEEGFVDVITSDDGKTYKMPDAEYTGSAVDRDAAMKKVKAAATRVGKKFSVLITQSNGRQWHNLDPA